MKRRDLLKFMSATAATTLLPGAACTQKERKPNIVFIMADDMGYGELNCYGNTFNETPNIDKLAADGCRYTNAYAAAAVCSPTRASIMTGLYPVKTGITKWLEPQEEPKKWLEPEKYVTINESLAKAGYHTGMIGKWHLDVDHHENPGSPVKHNWHEVIGTETKYIAMGDYFYPYDKISTFTEGAENEFLTDRLFAEAGGFIKRNAEKPFCLYLSLYSVHDKLAAPEVLVKKYKDKYDAKYGAGAVDAKWQPENWQKKGKPDNPWMAAMVEVIDNGVGMVRKQLEELGLADDTYIVFFSDNGGAGGVANNGPLRGAKGSHYEGGIREPMIVCKPGTVPAGTVSDVPTSSIDFYPTFCAWAGAPLPAGTGLDGLDITPTLTGGSLDRDLLFWHFAKINGEGSKSTVRLGDFKYTAYKGGKTELFNLVTDISEEKDLIETMPEKAAELRKVLKEWLQGAGGRLAGLVD